MNDDSNLSLQQLSPDERDAVAKILIDISHGSTDVYNTVINYDYDEMPVDIDTFLEDDEYLGKVTKNGKTIYPYWRNVLRDIFNNPDKNYHECLVGSTLVPLLDGSTKTIKELVEDVQNGIINYAYSYDLETNRYAPGKIINGKMTRVASKIYKITLDNEKCVECTGDHKFLTRDKHYVMAKNLEVGQSLMPLNCYVDSKGYQILRHPQKDGSFSEEPTHYVSMRYKGFYGKIGYVRHHKDFNKLNNDPRNLVAIPWAAHQIYHSNLIHKLHNDPSYTPLSVVSHESERYSNFREAHRIYMNSDKGKELSRQNLRVYQEALKAGDPEAVRKHREYSQKGAISRWSDAKQHEDASKRLIKLNSDPRIQQRQNKGRYLKVASYAISIYGCLNADTYEKARRFLGGPRPNFEGYYKCFSSIEEFQQEAENYNHKVVSVEIIDEQVNTYDIEVEKFHNFALASGIIVKNCIFTGKLLCRHA